MKLVVLAVMISSGAWHGAARAEAVTLVQVLAAADRAPAMAAGGDDIAAADATAAAASAWPAPALQLATDRLTARLVAGVTLPLPVFGTVGAARRVAAAEADVVRGEAARARRELRQRAAVAWIELARARDEHDALVAAAGQAGELETIARGRRDAGTAAEVDVTLAAAARAQAEAQAVAARRGERAAGASLAGVLGWDPARGLEAAGAFAGDGATADVAVDLADLRGRLAVHPERAVADRRIAAAGAARDAVGAQRWPAVAVAAELDYDDPTQVGRSAWARSDARLGVVLELPVFARLDDKARAASAAEAGQRARRAALDAELAGELTAAYERWRGAVEQLAATERDVVPAIERAAALAMQAYREGARDLATALIAARDLAAARAARDALRAAAALAYVELARASGRELDAR